MAAARAPAITPLKPPNLLPNFSNAANLSESIFPIWSIAPVILVGNPILPLLPPVMLSTFCFIASPANCFAALSNVLERLFIASACLPMPIFFKLVVNLLISPRRSLSPLKLSFSAFT